MDGDEAAIMLEKANVVRLEQVHREAMLMALISPQAVKSEAEPSHKEGTSVAELIKKRLRRGSRSPSPMSLLPGKGKKFKWKSSNDVSLESPPTNRRKGSTTTISGLAPSFPDVGSLDQTTMPSTPTAAVTPTATPTGLMGGSHWTEPSSCCETPTPTPRKRPLFVFPSRRIEDVPGIFIPGKPQGGRGRKSRAAEDAPSASNLLAVMREKPRRMSDPSPNFAAAAAAAARSAEAAKRRGAGGLLRSPFSTDSPSVGLHGLVCRRCVNLIAHAKHLLLPTDFPLVQALVILLI
jgi:hypothetical protein